MPVEYNLVVVWDETKPGQGSWFESLKVGGLPPFHRTRAKLGVKFVIMRLVSGTYGQEQSFA